MNRSSLPVDNPQREAFRSNLDSSFVVEAGAGTGKTTLLIDRVLNLIRQFDINDLAVVTFTEKAAGELIDRLRNKLESGIIEAASSDQRLQLMRVIDQIETAQISTLHSFAASIVREKAIEAGIDPEYTHLEPDEEGRLLSDVLSAELLHTAPDRDFWLSRFIALGGRLSQLIDLTGLVYANRDLLSLFKSGAEVTNIELRINDLITLTRELATNARENCTKSDDPGRVQIDELAAHIPDSVDLQEGLTWNWVIQASSLKKSKGKLTSWTDKALCKIQKERVGDLATAAGGLLKDVRQEVLERLFEWLREMLNRIEVKKRSSGKVGFQDLLIEARKILDSPAILHYFQDKFKRLLIDEFQDTDPLQMEIALLLAAAQPDGDDPFERPLEPGKISIVGDPKQSIYRFRRADPEMYQLSAQKILQRGMKSTISQNFRSSRGVVEFVNAFFEMIWTENDPGKIDYEPILADPGRLEKSSAPPVILLRPENPDAVNWKAEQIRQAEAEAIAGAVLDMHNDKELRVYDPGHSSSFRVPDWYDFTILFPTTTGIDVYGEALNALGIPFQVEGGKGFFRRKIINSIYCCLAAIDNPLDHLNVIAALRSDLLGASDPELLMWCRASQGRFDYRQPVTGISTGLQRMLGTLNRLHQARKDLAVEELLDLILKLTDAVYLAKSETSSWIDIQAIDRLRDHAQRWSSQHGSGLRGFRRWLKDRIEQGDDTATIPMSGSSRGVRLMTIHAAKGLEFPIVLIANMATYSYKKNPVIASRLAGSLNISIGSNDKGEFSSAGYQAASETDKLADVAERMRLLYVAMTRARDFLLLPMYYGVKKDGEVKGLYSKWLAEFVKAEDIDDSDGSSLWQTKLIPDGIRAGKSLVAKADIDINPDLFRAALREWENDRQSKLDRALEDLPTAIKPSEHETDPPDDMEQSHPESGAGASAIRLGSAFHEYMAKCELNRDIDQRFLSHLAKGSNVDESSLGDLVRKCLQSQLWKDVMAAERVWREAPVMTRSGREYMSGIIDLVWEDGDGNIHIVDYKTGMADPAGHGDQVKTYADALSRATGREVKSARLFYVRSGEVLEA